MNDVATDLTVLSYSVAYQKGQPSRAFVLGRKGGKVVLARARTGHRATMNALNAHDPLGRIVRIAHVDGINYIEADDKIGAPPGGSFLTRTFLHVKAERRGHVLEVTLNRPENMNALHSAAHFELHEIWDDFERDPDLWVAIITGAGDRAFCSGNDLKVTAQGGDMSRPWSGFGGLCNRFNREKPIIAAVNGVAMGGGLEIALACDLIVADASARMALPEVKVGLFAAAGGVQRLTRQIGRKAAMEMILTGKTILAPEALALGIVNQSVPAGTALEAARALAEVILGNSPSAIRASKQALNKFDEIESLEQALDANAPIIAELFRTRDMREGVTAFAQKRKPNWTNS
jgi:acetyl-CoA C-acetyltransferase